MLTRHSVGGLDFQSVEGKHAIISLCSARPLRAACGLNDVSLSQILFLSTPPIFDEGGPK
jgi:hypothetical protein